MHSIIGKAAINFLFIGSKAKTNIENNIGLLHISGSKESEMNVMNYKMAPNELRINLWLFWGIAIPMFCSYAEQFNRNCGLQQ